jgi:hypothetical protein
MVTKSREQHNWYFPLTHEGFMASAHGMSRLIESKAPDLAAHAKRLDLSIAQIVLTIFPTFFLPFTTLPVTLTVFDSYVLEGRKVLTRLCIVLMLKLKARLLKTESAREFLKVLISSIESLNSAEAIKELLKDGFKLALSRHRHISPAESSMVRHRIQLPALGHVHEMISGDIESRRHHSSALQMRSANGLNPAMARELQHVPIPNVIGGRLLTRELFVKLREHLPGHFQRFSAVCVFQAAEHGIALSSIIERAVARQPHILLIQTKADVIGAVLSDPPVRSGHQRTYFGSGVTFVFQGEKVYRRDPPGNDRFICVGTDAIIIGGPDAAVFLPDGMKRVVSGTCETFGSPPLTRGSGGDRVLDVELYALQMEQHAEEQIRVVRSHSLVRLDFS